MTPAQISKKYQLNEFIGAMRDEDADPIKIKSAELMIDKNQKSLSKLAFGQEAKKNFADGVPLAAHPYLVMQGIDPIEFTQKVENITKEQAAQRIFEGLSPEQQAQMMALRQMMEQAGQMQQPQAAYGMELPKAKNGIPNYKRMTNGKYGIPKVAEAEEGSYYLNPKTGQGYLFINGKYQEYQKELMTSYGEIQSPPLDPRLYQVAQDNLRPEYFGPNRFAVEKMVEEQEAMKRAGNVANGLFNNSTTNGPTTSWWETPTPTPSPTETPTPTPSSTGTTTGTTTGTGNRNNSQTAPAGNTQNDPERPNVAFDPALADFYNKYGINVNTLGIGASRYRDIQPREKGYSGGYVYGQASKNIEGFKEAWDGIYPELDELMQGIKDWNSKDPNPKVEKFQRWLNDTYIPEEIERIKSKAIESGQEWTDEQTDVLKENLLKDYGFNSELRGRGYDGDFGTWTSSRRPIGYTPIETPPEDTPKEGCPCEDGSYSLECCPKPGDIPDPYKGPDAEFWIQDMLKMGALAMRDRDMFLPWEPTVQTVQADYVLEEPTRQLADVNEQFNIASQAIGAFAGPQSLNARISEAAGNALRANANTFAQVHGRNINTVNQGKRFNATMEERANTQRNQSLTNQYDNTQLTLQNYMDEKNLDREQMADLTANAYTNMANTYNLNTLYPYYNIDPLTGGMINWVGGAPPLNLSKEAANQRGQFDGMGQRALELKGQNLDDSTINLILEREYPMASTAGRKKPVPSGNAQTDAVNMTRWESGIPGGYPTAKKGKEVKKYAVPFYIGKIGS
jgi:hypothetical protein